MRKQWLCLLLAALLLLSLTACGGEEPVEVTEAPTEASIAPTEEALTRLPVSAVPDDLFGSCSESGYTSSLLQIQFMLPTGWYFYSDSHLAQISGISLGEDEEPTRERFAAALKANGITYDMVACEEEGGYDSVTVRFEHMGYLYGKGMSEQEFAEAMLEKLSQRLPGIDSGSANAEVGTIFLARDEHPCLQYLSAENGKTLHKTEVFVQCGDFMAIVTASSLYEGDDISLIDGFVFFETEPPEAEEDSDTDN